MQFCTAISCIDGRIHLPVIRYLQNRFQAKSVDLVTEPAPDLILSQQTDTHLVESILARTDISVINHQSDGIAIIGHYDCAGNPAPRDEQIVQIQKSVDFIRQRYPKLKIIGLWVNRDWQVREVVV